MHPVFALTVVSCAAVAAVLGACGDRVDNNTVNINIGGDAGSDTTIGFDTAPTDSEGEVVSPGLCQVEGGIGCACTSNTDCNSTR